MIIKSFITVIIGIKHDSIFYFSQVKEGGGIRSNAPNFFMPREMLAQSMQKLRLAVTRQCDRKSEENVAESNTPGIGDGENVKRRFDRRKAYYATRNVKVSLEKPPPLEPNEINRIASIFSTKFT